jgi:hypothetical protein
MLTSILVKCTFDDTENIVLTCKNIHVTCETENPNRSIIGAPVYNSKNYVRNIGLYAIMAKAIKI